MFPSGPGVSAMRVVAVVMVVVLLVVEVYVVRKGVGRRRGDATRENASTRRSGGRWPVVQRGVDVGVRRLLLPVRRMARFHEMTPKQHLHHPTDRCCLRRRRQVKQVSPVGTIQ